MGIYLTMTFFGIVAVSVGPVPYDMNECMDRKAEIDQKTDSNFYKLLDETKEEHVWQGHKFTVRSDIKTYCTVLDHRPQLDTPFDGK